MTNHSPHCNGLAPAVATATECEACFTPDTCQLRGTCDHYAAEQLRIAAAAAAPDAPPVVVHPLPTTPVVAHGLANVSGKARPAIDEGRLWSILRTVMADGVDIALEAERLGLSYEERSARLDAASATRSEDLWRRLAQQPAAPAWPIWGVRVDGDTVVIKVKGGNDVARWLCRELVRVAERQKGGAA